MIEKEGPEGFYKKTSKIGLKESKAQDENNIISNRIDVSVLIIDCYQDYALVTIPYAAKNRRR